MGSSPSRAQEGIDPHTPASADSGERSPSHGGRRPSSPPRQAQGDWRVNAVLDIHAYMAKQMEVPCSWEQIVFEDEMLNVDAWLPIPDLQKHTMPTELVQLNILELLAIRRVGALVRDGVVSDANDLMRRITTEHVIESCSDVDGDTNTGSRSVSKSPGDERQMGGTQLPPSVDLAGLGNGPLQKEGSHNIGFPRLFRKKKKKDDAKGGADGGDSPGGKAGTANANGSSKNAKDAPKTAAVTNGHAYQKTGKKEQAKQDSAAAGPPPKAGTTDSDHKATRTERTSKVVVAADTPGVERQAQQPQSSVKDDPEPSDDPPQEDDTPPNTVHHMNPVGDSGPGSSSPPGSSPPTSGAENPPFRGPKPEIHVESTPEFGDVYPLSPGRSASPYTTTPRHIEDELASVLAEDSVDSSAEGKIVRRLVRHIAAKVCANAEVSDESFTSSKATFPLTLKTVLTQTLLSLFKGESVSEDLDACVEKVLSDDICFSLLRSVAGRVEASVKKFSHKVFAKVSTRCAKDLVFEKHNEKLAHGWNALLKTYAQKHSSNDKQARAKAEQYALQSFFEAAIPAFLLQSTSEVLYNLFNSRRVNNDIHRVLTCGDVGKVVDELVDEGGYQGGINGDFILRSSTEEASSSAYKTLSQQLQTDPFLNSEPSSSASEVREDKPPPGGAQVRKSGFTPSSRIGKGSNKSGGSAKRSGRRSSSSSRGNQNSVRFGSEESDPNFTAAELHHHLSKSMTELLHFFLSSKQIIPFALIVRKWTPFPLFSEYRVFVKAGEITAVSQYDYSVYSSDLNTAGKIAAIKHAIGDFFQKEIKPSLPTLPSSRGEKSPRAKSLEAEREKGETREDGNDFQGGMRGGENNSSKNSSTGVGGFFSKCGLNSAEEDSEDELVMAPTSGSICGRKVTKLPKRFTHTLDASEEDRMKFAEFRQLKTDTFVMDLAVLGLGNYEEALEKAAKKAREEEETAAAKNAQEEELVPPTGAESPFGTIRELEGSSKDAPELRVGGAQEEGDSSSAMNTNTQHPRNGGRSFSQGKSQLPAIPPLNSMYSAENESLPGVTKPASIKLIEFNPHLPITSGCLFDWQDIDDRILMEFGPKFVRDEALMYTARGKHRHPNLFTNYEGEMTKGRTPDRYNFAMKTLEGDLEDARSFVPAAYRARVYTKGRHRLLNQAN